MNCRKCGAENSNGSKYCNNCGEKLSTKLICSNCSNELLEGSKFCNECGTPVKNISIKENEEGFYDYNFFNATTMAGGSRYRSTVTKKGHYYYMIRSDSIYRFTEYCSTITKLFDLKDISGGRLGIGSRLNIIGEDIYFLSGEGVCKVSIDGKEISEIKIDIGSIEEMIVLGDRMYFNSYEGLFSTSLKGDQIKEIYKRANEEEVNNLCYGYKNEICIYINRDGYSSGYYIYDIVSDELKHSMLYINDSIVNVHREDIAVDLYNRCLYVKDNYKGIIRYDFNSSKSEIVFPSPNNFDTSGYITTRNRLNRRVSSFEGYIDFRKILYNGQYAIGSCDSHGNSANIITIDNEGYVELISEDGDYLGNYVSMFEETAFWYSDSYEISLLINLKDGHVREIGRDGKIVPNKLIFKD